MEFKDFESLLKVAGPIFQLGMQISAIETSIAIHSLKSVGSLSPMPFLALFVNNLIWGLYGYLRSDLTVLLPALFGVTAGLFCTCVYQLYSSKSPKFLYFLSFFVLLLVTYFYQMSNVVYIGYIGSFSSIIVLGSPLVTLHMVITERSTASMPFNSSLSAWLNSISWLAYGVLVADDPIIYFPNLVGLLLTSIQMSLYVLYGLPPPPPLPPKANV